MDRVDRLLEFLRDDPADSFTRFALAMEFMKSGDDERALEAFEKIVEQDPQYVGTYYHLAALRLRMGRRHEALETYRAGIEVADALRDTHARAELQTALLEAEGIGFDEE